MCIDLSKPDEQVDINDEDTWNVRWLDHEEYGEEPVLCSKWLNMD